MQEIRTTVSEIEPPALEGALCASRTPADTTIAEDMEATHAKDAAYSEKPRLDGHLTNQARLEGRWHRVFENSAFGIALTDLAGRFLSANAAYQAMLGYSEEELQKLTFLDLTHESDRQGNLALVSDLLADKGQQFQLEKRYRRKDGQFIWVNINVSLVPGDANSPRCMMAICEDITGRKWAEAVLAGEKRVLEMIAGGNPLSSILETVCLVVEGMAAGSLCSILLLDTTGDRLRHGAAPHLPESYTTALDGSVIDPSAGPCGRAAYYRGPLIACDIAAEPAGERFRDLALAHGLRACWSAPILSSEGKALGAFAIYSREPRSPTPQQRSSIERFAHLASIAIERTQSQDALRAAKARFEGILEIADDAIISIDSRHRIVLFNQGAEKVFGYEASEVVGTPLNVLLPQRFIHSHPKDIEAFARSLEVSRCMGERREVFGRRKDGSEFPAEASISKLDLGKEMVFTVILRDITGRKQAAEALRASAQLARGQMDALSGTLDALAMESAPDRLVEHVLRTIIGQLGAHSSAVWLRNEVTGLVNFEFAFEDGKFVTRTDGVLARICPTLKVEDVLPWPEIFRTGKPSVMEDIREGPSFPWRDHVLQLGVITIVVVPMLVAGRVEGVIGIRFTHKRTFRTEEMELAQALAHQAMLAIQLMRLSYQSRQAAVAAERNRMARDIHDTLAQGFTGVIVQLEAVEEAMSQRLTGKAEEHLARAGELARESLREARRSVQALRPQTLEDKDLCEALRDLIYKMTAGTTVQADFILEGEPRQLPPEWDENLLRIGQEVLTNVLRHAQASKFSALLAFDAEKIRLNLRDNGSGFNPAVRNDGFGLQGIRERVEGMGGQLSIESAKGQGTAVSLILPLAKAPESL